ncbi:NUDIX domain-containing protein [Acidiferrimicrobium sp. IK]|uniref:NUDIX domain-containing protein n=1 Tax=Acidiferrimicrobium sp. IK TaxID=2871700 RepID=UPI0021CB41D3
MWRRSPAGEVEVVLVHRPRYDDWSLPKGKVDDGESDEDAAVREVEEEASVRCRLGAELVSVSYTDRTRRPKTVRYWAMTVESGTVAGANEIDAAEWVALDVVREKMSYPRDHPVIDAFERVMGPTLALSAAHLDHVVLLVADVERSLAWYSGVLGLRGVRVEEWRRGDAPFPSVRVSPSTIIDLFAGEPTGANLDHLCVTVDPVDLAAVAAGGAFEVLDGPGPRFGARGQGTSLYVRDPDGNTVELRHY